MVVLMPKQSGELITKLAKDVTINNEGVKVLAKEIFEALKSGKLSIDGFSQHELHPQTANDSAADWVFVADTLNFSFWWPSTVPRKWAVTFGGKQYTGYFALCAAINRAIQEGLPMTDPNFYSKITKEQATHIFRSDHEEISVPLLDERVKCLHQVGKVLLEKYKGSFVNCIKESNNSAQKLLQLIVNDFHCFRDEAEYQGHKVAIYKRAQILIGDIWACFRGKGLGHFTDIDSIVMFADYRIPQVLVHFGAMKYSSKLMEKLKAEELMENGSEEEVEIRGCSIQAVELVCEEVAHMLQSSGCKDLKINSILIDHFLWDYRRQHAEELEAIPFHQVRTIYY